MPLRTLATTLELTSLVPPMTMNLHVEEMPKMPTPLEGAEVVVVSPVAVRSLATSLEVSFLLSPMTLNLKC